MPLKSKPKGAPCDLQHLLFVAFNLNILGFNGDKMFLAKSQMAST
jgi:hypothetical protein